MADQPAEVADAAEGIPEGASSGPKPTALAVSVTTLPTAGGFFSGARYSPRNCGSIWVENAQGQFVKTLEVWASGHCARGNYMDPVYARTGNNRVDAVTSGSLRTHQTHDLSWNLTDVSGAEVPDGEYTVWVMVCEGQHSNPPMAQASFTKGPQPMMQAVPDSGQFKDFTLDLN